MSRKRSATAVRKRPNPIARWGRYLLAGALLAVLVASGIAAQLFATSETPQSSSLEDADRTLNFHGHRLRPLVEEAGNAQTLNIYGPGGRIIGQAGRDGSGGQEMRHLLADHLGSTQAILDGGGNVVAQFEYGPYGKTRAAGTAATKVRYRYTGHPWDESQGLYQTPARGYDPTQGRFLSVDPQRQDASPYVYAGNNPIGYMDSSGDGKYPFYLYTGFKTRESGYTTKSFDADAVATLFGKNNSHAQYAKSAHIFNDLGGATSWAETDPGKYLSRDDVNYGKVYLFIGGDVAADRMERLLPGTYAMEGKIKGFARELTIINFSGRRKTGEDIQSSFEDAGRKPLLVHAGLETNHYRNAGNRVIKFTSGSTEYSPSEFVEYVRDLEKAHNLPLMAAREQRKRDRKYWRAWDEVVNWKPSGQESPTSPSHGASPMFTTVHSDPLDRQSIKEWFPPEQPMIPNLDPYDGE